MEKIITIDMFVLIPTNGEICKEFVSAFDKDAFVRVRDARGYELHPNYARLYLYMVIDTEGSGWCLTPNGAVTLEEAKFLIEQYL